MKQSTQKTGNGKRQLDPPTSFSDVLSGLTIHLCRKYLFISPANRIAYVGTFIFLGSLLSFMLPLPRTWYFARKDNFLNQYFAKMAWGWTFCLTGAFVVLTSLVYSSGNWRNVRQQMARLLVGTAVWFLVTTSFVRVERSTGACSLNDGGPASFSRSLCVSKGGQWLPGFDISGHCFLLIYCCFLISEEVKVFRNWDRIPELIATRGQGSPELSLLSETQKETTLLLHLEYTVWIKVLFVALAALHAIWDFLLFITTLFYHSFLHKMIASLIAVACWFLTYGVWYPSQYSPGMPGHCKMRYITWKRNK